ncbi:MULTISPECIES: ATP-binding protein [Nonlabens]|uniref:histidine kinase n=1 Tax=Nonlabens xylanidelens TaxID=191564 RepID=A0A2S6IQ73_9FLAO|nr:HAMP domain-containing sensor histidine kinase [Nonlabens xylanidelens]PPK96403.1 histidine kinase/DNA gyrase B/HSP90-like ATPase [Nonlabens xylanidelens]PQJ18128.1 hypothetical protein BST94_08965 [Nonlabens xylanidelens]
MKITPEKNLQQKLQDKDYFLKEAALLTATGSYSANLETGCCFIDDMGKRVLSLPNDYRVDFETGLNLFVDFKSIWIHFQNCVKGREFVEDLEMIDHNDQKIWMRATGKPLYDDVSGKVVGIRGVFTSIDRYVRQGKELEETAKIIEVQNERLVHFAHIVSHNLRVHSSNLELTLETFNSPLVGTDEKVFKSYLSDISNNLSETLEHLNEVVTINTHEKSKEPVDIESVFKSVLEDHRSLLEEIDVSLKYDFSNLSHIDYVPTFLSSIFSNLLSNAIKYRDSSKTLKINVKTKAKRNNKLLTFQDNGIGIDLDRNGTKIFNMYKTFHDNEDARGIGLFLTKNQVESLGGNISVVSEVGKGSLFTVKF